MREAKYETVEIMVDAQNEAISLLIKWKEEMELSSRQSR